MWNETRQDVTSAPPSGLCWRLSHPDRGFWRAARLGRHQAPPSSLKASQWLREPPDQVRGSPEPGLAVSISTVWTSSLLPPGDPPPCRALLELFPKLGDLWSCPV